MFSETLLLVFIFTFPFSPKIPVGIWGTTFLIRLDDLLVPLLFVVWLGELLFKKRQLVYSRLYLPVGAYCLAGLISTLSGYYRYLATADPFYYLGAVLRSAEYYIIFFLAVNILKTKKQVTGYLHIWVVAAAGIGLYGVADHLLGISGPTGLFDRGWFFRQSNHMGGFLMLSLMVALGLLSACGRRLTRLWLIAAATLISYTILFSLSRTTYISTLVALCVFSAARSRKLLWISLICAVLLFVVIPAIFPRTHLGKRTANIVSDIFTTRLEQRNAFDSMALHRAKCLYVFRDFPRDALFGKGLGFYPLYEYDSQLTLVPVATGVVGSVIFLWLLAAIFRMAWAVFKRTQDDDTKYLALAFIAAYCGVLVHGLASTAFMIALIAYPFWLLTASVDAISRLSTSQNN